VQPHTPHVGLSTAAPRKSKEKGIEGEAFDKTDYVSEHHQAPLALKKNIIQSWTKPLRGRQVSGFSNLI
jgi:hypothetical protein